VCVLVIIEIERFKTHVGMSKLYEINCEALDFSNNIDQKFGHETKVYPVIISNGSHKL